MVGEQLLRSARQRGDVFSGDGFIVGGHGYFRSGQRIDLPQRPDILRIHAPGASASNMGGLKSELRATLIRPVQNLPNTLMAQNR